MTLACNSHLLLDLPIFFAPVAVMAGWLVYMTRRDRRRDRRRRTAATQG